MEDNRVIKMQGKYGKVNLIIPNRQPTEEELDSLYTTLAQALLESRVASRQVNKQEKSG